MKFVAKNESTKTIEVYTDGGCRSTAQKKGSSVNPNDKSAYAFFLKSGGKELLKGGFDRGKTNNYMEIKAVVEALKYINDTNRVIDIKSDSMYVVNSINKGWMKGWKKRGWKKSDDSVPANVELWKELDQQFSRFPFIAINHVKGHSGDEFNELVDGHVNDLMDSMDELEKEQQNEQGDNWSNVTEKISGETDKLENAKTKLQETYEYLEHMEMEEELEAIELLTGIRMERI